MIGIDTPLDKIKRYFSHANITPLSQLLKTIAEKRHTQLAINKIIFAPGLFINGRVIMNKRFIMPLINLRKSKPSLTYQGHVIAIYVSDELYPICRKHLKQHQLLKT